MTHFERRATPSHSAGSASVPPIGQWLRERPSPARRTGVVVDAVLPAAEQRGSRDRAYRLRLPTGYDATRPAALWMVLHGCHQTQHDIEQITAFERHADGANAILVYPFVTSYSEYRQTHCWGWWLDAHRRRGGGEAGDLRRLAGMLEQRYAIDPGRRFICGLSAGAAMAVACLVVDADYWCGGASIGGIVYGETARAVRLSQALPIRHRPVVNLLAGIRRAMPGSTLPPLLIVQTRDDARVPLQCALDLRDCWTRQARERGSVVHHRLAGLFAGAQRWDYEEWVCHDGGTVVAACLLDGDLHGWSGGRSGPFSDPDGPNLSRLVSGFYSRLDGQCVDEDAPPA